MAKEWPLGNIDTSLNLLQLATNIDGTAFRTRASSAGDTLSLESTKARHITVGGIYTSATPTLTDGQAAAFRFTSDNRLCVDTELTIDGGTFVVNNVAVGSTDGTTYNSALKVSSAHRLENLIWGKDVGGTEVGPVTVDDETVNAVPYNFIEVGGSDLAGVPRVLKVTAGGLVVVPSVVGPSTILTDSSVGAGSVLGTVVNTTTCGSGLCFSVSNSGVVLGGGTLSILLEWGFDAAGPFYPFTGGTIAIAADGVDLYQFSVKAPYIRCSRVVSVGITSATTVVQFFGNSVA